MENKMISKVLFIFLMIEKNVTLFWFMSLAAAHPTYYCTQQTWMCLGITQDVLGTMACIQMFFNHLSVDSKNY